MMPVVEDACRLINDQTAFIISSAQRQKNIPLTQISLIDRIRIQKQKSYQYMWSTEMECRGISEQWDRGLLTGDVVSTR